MEDVDLLLKGVGYLLTTDACVKAEDAQYPLSGSSLPRSPRLLCLEQGSRSSGKLLSQGSSLKIYEDCGRFLMNEEPAVEPIFSKGKRN